MRSRTFNRSRIFARWFLLFSVLAGSAFSGGEGVHLLPFPDTIESSDASSQMVNPSGERNYTLSVCNSSNISVSKAGSGKKAKKDIAVARPDRASILTAGIAVRRSDRNFELVITKVSAPYLSGHSGRGPPVLFNSVI